MKRLSRNVVRKIEAAKAALETALQHPAAAKYWLELSFQHSADAWRGVPINKKKGARP